MVDFDLLATPPPCQEIALELLLTNCALRSNMQEYFFGLPHIPVVSFYDEQGCDKIQKYSLRTIVRSSIKVDSFVQFLQARLIVCVMDDGMYYIDGLEYYSPQDWHEIDEVTLVK